MKTTLLLLLLASSLLAQPGPPIPCVGGSPQPGATFGPYLQQCMISGAVYACNNVVGCKVAADWIAVGGSGSTPTTVGVPLWGGTSWGISYTVGTGANNLVQLNSSSQLPAVSAALLTNVPGGTPLSPPTGFIWQTPPLQIYQLGPKSFTTPFDVNTVEPCQVGAGCTTYYVDQGLGSDSNACTASGASACATLSGAMGKTTNNQIISIAPTGGTPTGWYGTTGMNASAPQHSVLIEPSAAGVVISGDTSGLSYSVSSGACYTTATASNYDQVIDAKYNDANGVYSQLTQVASSAACASTAQSWYYDGSAHLYIHLQDGRAPDAYVKTYIASETTIYNEYPVTLAIDGLSYGLTILGSDKPYFGSCVATACTTATGPSVNILRNVTIELASINASATYIINGNSYQPTFSYTQGVLNQQSAQDNFSYASTFSSPTWAIGVYAVEINDTGQNTVWPSTASTQNVTQNATTSHEYAAVIRMQDANKTGVVSSQALYTNTYGPVCADVGGSETWNLGVTCSLSQAPVGQNNDIESETTPNPSLVWYEGTTSVPSAGGHDVNAFGGTVYYDQYATGRTLAAGSAAIVAFTPATAQTLQVGTVSGAAFPPVTALNQVPISSALSPSPAYVQATIPTCAAGKYLSFNGTAFSCVAQGLQSEVTSTTDNICNWGGDTTIAGVTCANGSGTNGTSAGLKFANTVTVPALTYGQRVTVCANFRIWSSATAPAGAFTIYGGGSGGTTIITSAPATLLGGATGNREARSCFVVTPTSDGTHEDTAFLVNGQIYSAANNNQNVNDTSQPVAVTLTGSQIFVVGWQWTNSTGVGAPASYVSGITASGTGTCLYLGTGGTGGEITFPITAGAVGTPTLTVPGYGYSASNPTSWTFVSNVTATCSGTATTSGGSLGPASGNAILQSALDWQMN